MDSEHLPLNDDSYELTNELSSINDETLLSAIDFSKDEPMMMAPTEEVTEENMDLYRGVHDFLEEFDYEYEAREDDENSEVSTLIDVTDDEPEYISHYDEEEIEDIDYNPDFEEDILGDDREENFDYNEEDYNHSSDYDDFDNFRDGYEESLDEIF